MARAPSRLPKHFNRVAPQARTEVAAPALNPVEGKSFRESVLGGNTPKAAIYSLRYANLNVMQDKRGTPRP